MSACTWAGCGMCGRCSSEWERPTEREPVQTCDTCAAPLIAGWTSLAGVGVFCNRRCAQIGVEKHEAHMARLTKAG